MTSVLLQELLQSLGFWVPSSWFLSPGKLEDLLLDQKKDSNFLEEIPSQCYFRKGEIVMSFLLVWLCSWKKTNHKVAKQIRHESSVHLSSFSYRGCDKPCGGGQQSREKVCLGSDGLKYPSLLGLLVVVSGEFSFNCSLLLTSNVFFLPKTLGSSKGAFLQLFWTRRNILRSATSLIGTLIGLSWSKKDAGNSIENDLMVSQKTSPGELDSDDWDVLPKMTVDCFRVEVIRILPES